MLAQGAEVPALRDDVGLGHPDLVDRAQEHELLPAFQFCPYCGIRAEGEADAMKTKSSQKIISGVLTS